MSQVADRHFDVIVIGSGSGNSLPDDRFADKSLAIIEKGVFGGTCINVGCIPTKMFVYAADVAESARTAGKLGVDARVDGVRWRDIVSRVFDDRIDRISEGGLEYRRTGTPNVTLYESHARFVGPRTLDTGTGEIISGDQIVLAAGGRPVIPQVVTDSGVPYYTSDDVMRIPELPERLVILGSGFIACEFAHVFSSFGVEVSVIGRSEVLLKHSDRTISERFTEVARSKWTVHLGNEATEITERDGEITVHFPEGSTVSGDALLVATGRTPNGDLLSAEKGGIDTEGGRVVADEYGRTSAEGVWAVGDVSSPSQLKHVANHELRVVQHNLLNPDDLRAFNRKAIPNAVFSSPQVASVGLTEDEARAAGYDVTVKVQAYGDVAYGWAMEDSVGLCKLVADRSTGRLLGGHMLGSQAASLVQLVVQAIQFDLPVQQMAREQLWIHPALSEVVENALLGLDFPDRGF